MSNEKNETKEYSRLSELPNQKAGEINTHGCLVAEGGGWRGLYTAGVLDELMLNDLNFDAGIGVSSGALNLIPYMSGQIGKGATIALKYRNDPRVAGVKETAENKGIVGFNFLLEGTEQIWPTDWDRFYDSRHECFCVATNCDNGKAQYFDKFQGQKFWGGLRAGATLPFVSEPYKADGTTPFLDGGIADPIPYQWAMDHGHVPVVVIRTQDYYYRKPQEINAKAVDLRYGQYKQLCEELKNQAANYNHTVNEIERLREEGKLFVLRPSRDISGVDRLGSDVEQLGELYWLGRADTNKALDSLRAFLEAHKNDGL